MIILPQSHLRLRHILLYGFTAFLLVYFAYHALSGSRGVWAMLKLRGEIDVAQNTLDGVRAERLAMEDRIRGLYTKSLNTDLLEEQARLQLGYAYPQEMVIYIKSEDEK
jgi:cell division protein FtsB